MENFFAIVVILIPIIFIIGMIKPEWIVPNRFKIKNKRWFIFLMSFLFFCISTIAFALITESNLTPEEKFSRDAKIKVEELKQEKEKHIKDSLINMAIENSTPEKLCKDSFQESKKGDKIYAGEDYEIEVLKIKDKKRNAIILEAGYGKFRYFYLKITNTSKYPKDIDRDSFIVESEDGAIYEHSTTQAIVDFVISINRDAFAGEDLAPNVPVKGIVAFEVPKDGKYKLKFQP